MDVHDIYHDFSTFCASVFSSGARESFGVLDEASLVFTGRRKGTQGKKVSVGYFPQTPRTLLERICQCKDQVVVPQAQPHGALLQVQDPASFIKLFMRKHVQCWSRRCVLDLPHSLLKKTFLRDVLDTFHIQLLALRYWYMHNLSNGVLLHTLKFLLLGSDLFLMDLVVHRRRRHVHGRKNPSTIVGTRMFVHGVLLNSLRSRCHMVLVLQRCQQVQVPRTRLLKKALHR